ncbi:MAG: carboxypeptidase-like regulatory domain-containing protein [Gemmatimonas sp.]
MNATLRTGVVLMLRPLYRPARQLLVAVLTMSGLMASMALLAAQAQSQPSLPILRVFVRDSATQDTLAGGTVELRSRDVKRTAPLGANGMAVFTSLAAGAYSISIVRMGYRPHVAPMLIGVADTTMVLLLEPLPAELAQFQVRAKATQEIFGVVGVMPGPNPVVGATVQISPSQKTTTDSAGKYYFRNLQPGEYTLRISAPGFVDRIGMLKLPEATALESSHLIDRGKPFSHTMTVAWREMQLSLRTRTFGSAVVTADELYRYSGGLRLMLQRIPEVSAKGINTENACVVLDGQLLRGRTTESINPSGISFVIVHDGGPRAPSPSLMRHQGKCGPASIEIWTNR